MRPEEGPHVELSAANGWQYGRLRFKLAAMQWVSPARPAYDRTHGTTCPALIRPRDQRDMSATTPKYITFDCYGTLTFFQMSEAASAIYGATLSPEAMAIFNRNFAAYRLDEIMGDWKPYAEVLHNAVERTCRLNGVAFRPEDARAIYEQVPSWGPHPDVPAGLARVAKEIPLVILSNAMDSQIMSNVEKLGAPFHRVYTAQQAQAYKPRFRAFEYMFDMLGCGPEDIMHVSSSFRYDLMSAHDLGISRKVWVNRGHEPANPYYGYTEIRDISALPGVLGM